MAYLASSGFVTGAGMSGPGELLQRAAGWRVLVDVVLVAVSGGLYIVPLNTAVQARSESGHVARNIAAVNIMNSLFMVISAIASGLLLASGVSVPGIFLALGVANLGVVIFGFRNR